MKEYRPDIDGMRAIAAVAVLLGHVYGFHSGFIGVDIFFVISGFLITSIILRSLKEGTFSIGDFYIRRITRIFPALLATLAGTLLVARMLVFKKDFAQIGFDAFAASTFWLNLSIIVGRTNLTGFAPLAHIWSLGVEEQYYIIWPVVLALAYKRRWPIFKIAVYTAAVSFALNLSSTNHTIDYCSPTTRAWQLMIGSLLALREYWILPANMTINPWILQADSQAFIGAALLGFGFMGHWDWYSYPGLPSVLPTLGTAFLIYAGKDTMVNRILSNRVAVLVGLISYPLYLWHHPINAFAHSVFGSTFNSEIKFIVTVLSFLLAWMTYAMFEKPVKVVPTYFRVPALAALMLALAVVGCQIRATNGLATQYSSKLRGDLIRYFQGG